MTIDALLLMSFCAALMACWVEPLVSMVSKSMGKSPFALISSMASMVPSCCPKP